jgi:ribulose-phosphate 3-epimerase
MAKGKISPSMMCADFINLKEVLDIFAEEAIDYLHIDIMDGHYVPNFTLGVDFCRALSRYSSIPLDIHLMVNNPDEHIEAFSSFSSALYCIHPETSPNPLHTVHRIRESGLRPGLTLKPEIPLASVAGLLPHIDLLNIMTVHPGYSGQPLIPGTIDKIAGASAWIGKEGLQVEIEVDGNVSWENLPKMLAAGADVFVAGTSSVFQKDGDLRANIRRFRALMT